MARPANIKRETILEVAKDLFFEKGIAKTEMKEIADKSQIGRSSLYRHFESKEAIALELVIELLDKMNQEFDQAIQAEVSGYEKVRIGLTFYIEKMYDSIPSVRFLDDFDSCFYHEYPPNLSEGYIQRLRNRHDSLKVVLEQAAKEGEVQLIKNAEYTSKFLMNVLFGLSQRILPRAKLIRQEQGYAEEYLEDMLMMLMAYIKPPIK
ncbi:TetR/AcrR family transcriptional regulator [Scatolibacter rhodanostii]|uniref:TetR/AcrR family transcriptional regulator n=1 Tax=Scatolibacter rhodanostii TaxID=2014781 RepID=UPI0013563D05|nr:TetR/AcrR family transcriptional regulator [Scatolibacter rhodanostii]